MSAAPTAGLDGVPGRGRTALLLALAVAPYFVCLGSPALWDANEPLYAQPPHEALDWPEGDILAPTWNGKPYFAHAPLSTWVTLPFYALLGVDEVGHRLPMALAAILIVLATYRLGSLLGGRRIGLFAAIAVAATPRVWLFCRQLSGDVYLTTILVWALALALPAVAGQTKSLRGLRAANLLVGFGFTAKGPVILVVYGGVILLTWLVARPRATWASLRPWRGLALICAAGAPWFVYMFARYEWTFLDAHFGHYTLRRMAGDIGVRSWFFYFQVLLGDGQPWVTLLPFAGLLAWKARDRRAAALLPWLGMLWIVFFFTLSAGKRNVYLLPLYPLMAVAMAPLAQAVWRGAYRPGVRLAGLGAAVGCVVGAGLLFIVGQNEPRLRPELYIPLGVFAVAGIPLFVAGWRGHGRLLCGGSLATLLLLQAAAGSAFPALVRFRPVPLMAARMRAEQSAAQPEPAVIYRVAIHSLNFYLDRPTKVAGSVQDLLAKIAPARSAFVLVPAHRYDAPGKVAGGARVGLKNELPEADFEELERHPVVTFQFKRSILGHSPMTRDLLLVRLRLDEDPGAILRRRFPDPVGGEDR